MKNGLFLFFVLLYGCCSGGGLLSPEGRPYQAIVIAPDAPEVTQYAAKELREHLKLTFGSAPPILTAAPADSQPVILLGEAAANRTGISSQKIPSEGFRILSRNDCLAIVGRDGKSIILKDVVNAFPERFIFNRSLGIGAYGQAGTLYGVYRFLEDYLGVRWYMPGVEGTVIQSKESVQIPLFELEDAPNANCRDLFFCIAEKAPDSLRWIRQIRGGSAAPVHINHSYYHMLQYKDSHPEYFALTVGGKRDFTNACAVGGRGHLCLTNPATAERFAADIIDYFDRHPQQNVFPLVPMDGLIAICQCPDCQKEIEPERGIKGKFSRHIWNFTNRVARMVAKRHPNKLIGTLAYDTYTLPPENFRLEPNIAVRICYQRSLMINPEYRREVESCLNGWSKLTKNLYTWNWYLEHRVAFAGLPAASPRQVLADYRELAAKGKWKGEFIEAEGDSSWSMEKGLQYPGMQHLLLYVSCRAMWNSPDVDIEKLLSEYYRLFYGPAEVPMRTFFETAFASYEHATFPPGDKRPQTPEMIFPDKKLRSMNEAIHHALKLTPENSVYRRRVELIKCEFDPAYAKLRQFINTEKPVFKLARIKTVNDLDQVIPQCFLGRNGTESTPATWVATGTDNRNLFLRFYCYETDMDKIKASCTQRDSKKVWNDDVMEIFLCPDPANAENCVQFAVNAAGTLWDGRRTFGLPVSSDWNSKAVSLNVRRDANRWILDMTVPFAELDPIPAPGSRIKANFIRTRPVPNSEASCWSPVFARSNFMPNRFGELEFPSK